MGKETVKTAQTVHHTGSRCAYYNENNPFAASWLKELIKAGMIAPGEVDDRSIEDVTPNDLMGYTQYHFFAGIGVWSYALRCAGWPDDRPVWTGSCPCQPFSVAGKQKGFSDERHLWPVWFRLIAECKPFIVFGEQVASRGGFTWFDAVSSDMENAGYTCGAVDTCAAGFGAPHIRQRLYWVAYADGEQSYRSRCQQSERRAEFADGGGIIGLADPAFRRDGAFHGKPVKGVRPQKSTGGHGFSGGLGNAGGTGLEGYAGHGDGETGRQEQDRSASTTGRNGGSLPTDGFWRNADWLLCKDRKWRPVEPGTFPLAHGTAARVGRLRGYGNAICAPQAEVFIRAVMEYIFTR